MAEIFKEAQAFNNNPDRWNHDNTHKIYGSFQMGKIYPVMSQFMMPTDTAKLDIAALLQFMPTATPLQSNVRVIFHTFFQRMKNIVKSWPNFIEQLEEHDMPYILPSVTEFKPGSLHDFLDVPVCTVYHGVQDIPFLSMPSGKSFAIGQDYPFYATAYGIPDLTVSYGAGIHVLTPYSFTNKYGFISFSSPLKFRPVIDIDSGVIGRDQFSFILPTPPFKYSVNIGDLPEVGWDLYLRVSLTDSPSFSKHAYYSSRFVDIEFTTMSQVGELPNLYKWTFDIEDLDSALETLGYTGEEYICYDFLYVPLATLSEGQELTFSVNEIYLLPYPEGVDPRSASFVLNPNPVMSAFISNSYSLADFPASCPYATQEYPDRPVKLSAYRYRVYESIYNAFYRNINGNQPFVIDGVTQYNKYNTTTEDGLDGTHYDFFYRNYELDAYTSCLPSPQQGNPPLVGISATGRLTVQDDDGTRSTAQLEDLPNGQQGLAISQIDIQNDSHRNIIMSLASSGFTINDLREANALQKFLETNIRKGFRYIDFIMGHFGKAPKHAEMDMPEFVGGTSIRLDVSKVTNTNAAADANNPNDVLGQFAGAAQAFGSSKNSMQYYADDYGYLMTVMCIVPDTCYSQVLPKDFLYRNALDFPFPEFSNLGYQPITYEEFCPVEAYKDYLEDSDKKITDVFGYQRPQHELVWKPDRLHGQFLTTMNNYAISRFFDGRPELGNDFLTIKPEETQNVFTVTKADNDIAFGQIGFSLTMKRPVPRISLPSIGR